MTRSRNPSGTIYENEGDLKTTMKSLSRSFLGVKELNSPPPDPSPVSADAVIRSGSPLLNRPCPSADEEMNSGLTGRGSWKRGVKALLLICANNMEDTSDLITRHDIADLKKTMLAYQMRVMLGSCKALGCSDQDFVREIYFKYQKYFVMGMDVGTLRSTHGRLFVTRQIRDEEMKTEDRFGLSQNLARQLIHEGDATDVWLYHQPGKRPSYPPNINIIKKVMRIAPSYFENPGTDQGEDMLTGLRKSFDTQYRKWMSLRHPHTAQIYAVTSNDLTLYQEYYSNGDLRQYITQGISEASCTHIVRDVLSAVCFLHGHNPPIVHGSINPEKIFIGFDGKAKLGEFSISKLVSPFPHLAPSISLDGSLRWLGPECFQFPLDTDFEAEDLPLTTETDIWAFGCTVFEMLTGYPPYYRYDYDAQILERIMDGELPGSFEEIYPSCGARQNNENWLDRGSTSEQGTVPTRNLNLGGLKQAALVTLTSCYISNMRKLVEMCWLPAQQRATSDELSKMVQEIQSPMQTPRAHARLDQPRGNSSEGDRLKRQSQGSRPGLLHSSLQAGVNLDTSNFIIIDQSSTQESLKTRISETVGELTQKAMPGDVIVLYFQGHGLPDTTDLQLPSLQPQISCVSDRKSGQEHRRSGVIAYLCRPGYAPHFGNRKREATSPQVSIFQRVVPEWDCSNTLFNTTAFSDLVAVYHRQGYSGNKDVREAHFTNSQSDSLVDSVTVGNLSTTQRHHGPPVVIYSSFHKGLSNEQQAYKRPSNLLPRFPGVIRHLQHTILLTETCCSDNIMGLPYALSVEQVNGDYVLQWKKAKVSKTHQWRSRPLIVQFVATIPQEEAASPNTQALAYTQMLNDSWYKSFGGIMKTIYEYIGSIPRRSSNGRLRYHVVHSSRIVNSNEYLRPALGPCKNLFTESSCHGSRFSQALGPATPLYCI